ncbi:hypothetical protein G5C66_25185 [Nocardioides sp. KC13]|uniref:Uncharacterized protein n=1 Tax=Nocardioides turkmenicus TaxID=2711220 RepID=A0A6M1REK7_9ACTN|nr:hypothetical protein [Nocardioides sp. KC13]NGN96019.1 hypothetical protein [Nocardioides sp. KC13]
MGPRSGWPTCWSRRDGFGLDGLRAAVKNLRKEYVDPDGNPAWVLLRGESPQGPVVASAVVPLHPVTAPNLTHHVGVMVPTSASPSGVCPRPTLFASSGGSRTG